MAFEYPKLRLYRASGSCSLVPHMLLRHLDLPFDDTPLVYRGGAAGGSFDAADGSFDAAAYRRDVNSAGQVPALAVGAGDVVVITQNAAVLGYLAGLAQQAGHAGSAGLLGGDALLARARVQQWLAYATSFVHAQGFALGYAPASFLDVEAEADGDDAVRARVVAKGGQKIAAAFARLEAELDGAAPGFAVGPGLTLVDFYVYLFWRWSRYPIFQAHLPGPYPRLEAIARNVETLPGVRKALEVEGLDRVFAE